MGSFFSSGSIELGDKEYKEIANFVHQASGINLLDGKKELMRARLTKRIRLLNFDNFKDYFDHVVADQTGEEMVFLLDALATNLTSFYREPQHFDYMVKNLLPAWEAKRKATNSRRLRIWSAACSSGEEPYTIAMVALENSSYFGQGNDFKILATDLSTKVLSLAKRGVYGQEQVRNIPIQTLNNFFTKSVGEKGTPLFSIKDQVRNLISFRRFNLMDPLPFKGPLDLIFCRNVMIYFDKETITKLVDKYYNVLEKGGYLFIGHSESLSGIEHRFKYVAPCIYLKE